MRSRHGAARRARDPRRARPCRGRHQDGDRQRRGTVSRKITAEIARVEPFRGWPRPNGREGTAAPATARRGSPACEVLARPTSAPPRRSARQLLERALHDASTDVISTSFLISRATTSTEKRAIKWPEQGGSRRISRRGTARTRAPNLNFPGFRNRNSPSESLRLSSIPLLISGSGPVMHEHNADAPERGGGVRSLAAAPSSSSATRWEP